MRCSLRLLFLSLTLTAFFLGGWLGHQRFEDWRNEQLAQQNKQSSGNTPTTSLSPARISGVVTRTEKHLIVISLGSDDGIRNGHTVKVFRGNRYLGSATVTQVSFNQAAARIVPPRQPENTARQGDYVSIILPQ